ncbi:RHS repeat-associated core domain-containing protein [Sorangium sp. So ce381]|uniref:RHS repeat-associated core domain-containing protein n=1 Tax=Sorangium sp. So ce381 TaxID=3133307 RepID=UPI003F5C1A00
MATINYKYIATTRSNHFCPGFVPALSHAPPVPPVGPVPTPFPYVALSSSATDTGERIEIGGAPVLLDGSTMNVQAPGNAPCQGTGGDAVTHVVNKACNVFTSSTTVVSGDRGIACTGDHVWLNAAGASSDIAQISGVLLAADIIQATTHSGATVNVMVVLDPISVASGAMVDESIDISIPGLIPIEWKRLYSSACIGEHTPLGRGGWTHSYHQWIELAGDTLHLRDADGATITVRDTKPREPAFHRGKRLVFTRDSRGGATVFSLDTRLTRTFRPSGGGRAVLHEITNESGHKVILEYEVERLARVVDTARRTITLKHDGNGHLVRLDVFPPGGEGRAPIHAVSFAYNDAGELAQVTDALGHTETYGYDEQRRLTRKTLPTGLSFHYLYDAETGRCIRSWGDGDLHAGDLTYDLDQGITHFTGNPEPRVFKWQPEDGSVVREASTDGLSVRDLEFDADGLLLKAKNAAGDTLTLTRDPRGNITRMADPLGPLVELDYAEDLLVQRRVGGVRTDFGYDHRNRLISIKYASGAFLALKYDEQGRLAEVHGPDGLRGAFIYDEQHNAIEEHTPRGGIRRWRHDALGRPVAYVDPLGRVTRRELDALGRPVALHLPDGTSLRFEHDALGRLTRRTDALGRVEAFRYAGLKSPIEAILPDGSVWSLSYDLNERLQQVMNPKGETFDFRYDRAGNLREHRSYDGRVSRAQHGKNGRLVRVENPDGTFRALRYDGAGRLVAEETPHGAIRVETPEDRVVEYIVDDPSGEIRLSVEHDTLGRVVGETQNGRTIRYEYDSQNRCVARHLPTGHVTRYAYDEEGNVSSLDHDGYRVEIQRDLAGSVVRKVFVGAGVEARRELDPMARPIRDWVGVAERTLVDRRYAYDPCGALVERNDRRWGLTRYGYDRLGMLLEVSSPKGRESFVYDAGGSLKPASSAWETGPGGLLLRTEEATYAYDSANRRIREARSDGETQYLWDCRGQLREAQLCDGTRVLFSYDAFSRRIRKEIIPPSSPGALAMAEAPKPRVVEYLWDGLCLAAELDSERGVRIFVHEPGTMCPLLQQEGAAVHAVITDHLGTPTELIGVKGDVAWSARHAAFGLIVETARREGDSSVASPFRLLGQYHDEETGLCYVRYRYFDPKTARFLTPDPLELLGSRNLFAFDGSPTTHVDPLGLSCVIIGNPAHDKFIAVCMTEVKPDPSKYVIAVHGTAHHVAVRDANGMTTHHTPRQLLEMIGAVGNYNSAGNIVLNSCNVGRMPDGVAQQISLSFPNRYVYGPSDVVWNLGLYIGPPVGVANSATYVPKPGKPEPPPDYTRPGQWNSFYNGMPRQGNRHDQYTTLPRPINPGSRTQPLDIKPGSNTQPLDVARPDNGLPFRRPPSG